MRLLVYNNNELKYAFKASFNAQKNLYAVFEDPINTVIKDNRKKLLWATAFQNLKTVVIDGSKSDLAGKDQGESGRTIITNNSYPYAFDFYLDRGTGWCAMARNYSICTEINDAGNIPNKGTYLTNFSLPPLWNDYGTNSIFGKSSGSTQKVANIVTGAASIIPPGIGNFYGGSRAMTKDKFEALSQMVNKMAATVRAVMYVEWPAAIFDNCYLGWKIQYNKDIDDLQSRISKATVTTKTGLEKQLARLQKEVSLLAKAIPNIQALQKFYNTKLPKEAYQCQDNNHTASFPYLFKLRSIDTYLSVLMREMRFMTTSYHFDSSKLDLTWYQQVYSSFLYSLGSVVQLVGKLVTLSAEALDKSLPVPVAADRTKQFFGEISGFLFQQQAAYKMGGVSGDLNKALSDLLDLLMISYIAYEVFLDQWGILEFVTNRNSDQLARKLEKVEALMRARNEKQGLPVVDLIRDKASEYIDANG